jgi:hypothetical protein
MSLTKKKQSSEVTETAKQVGKTTVGVAKTALEGLVDVGRELGKITVEGVKAVGRGATKVGEKVADAVDITCDHCNKLMKPGFMAVKRKLWKKEYQFCSEKCAKKFTGKR